MLLLFSDSLSGRFPSYWKSIFFPLRHHKITFFLAIFLHLIASADKLEARKRDIEIQIIQEEMKRPILAREDMVYWICRFRVLNVSKLEERRRLIDSFVNSVTIFNDHILITFN